MKIGDLFVLRRKPQGKRLGERILIKCRDCDNRLKIYDLPGMLEINGVAADKETWAQVLVPLLSQWDNTTITTADLVTPETWRFTPTHASSQMVRVA